MPCQKIDSMGGIASKYQDCRINPNGRTIVYADFTNATGVEQIAAAMDLVFGASAWLALWIHAVGVEIYIRLTPAEGERLRKVSWELQVERGSSRPGSAGLTVDRFGDAEKWTPPKEEEAEE